VLATDEALRRRFIAKPKAALLELSERGMELTPCELGSLVSLDPLELARFAEAIDARLQKTDLQRGVT
jgi:hypothetical protein